MSKNILRVKDPPEDVSSTTLKQWQRSKIRMTTKLVYNWQGEYVGRITVWNPWLNHPAMRRIKTFFDRVDRAQKKGLGAVLALQQELKLEEKTRAKKN